MKEFMCKDFLLDNETAKTLYHEYAKDMPIYDYHCHINPKDIAEDKKYDSITQVWLGGDHYKWRVMRINGIDEEYITGTKSDWEKFEKWSETVPYTIGNPMYHWTHMELRKYFGVYDLLNEKTGKAIYDKCNEVLKDLSVRDIIRESNVKMICTTDDPVDSLEYHAAIANDETFDVKVLPAFRPDKAVNVEADIYYDWFSKLVQASGIKINSFADYKKALENRMDFFHANGCRLSDHGLTGVDYAPYTQDEVSAIFDKVLAKEVLCECELVKFKTAMMVFFGREYKKRNWTMQYHIGALRNNSQRQYKKLGPDVGFDSIADNNFAENLSNMLDALDITDELPKTILYCLNPRDNEVLATMCGNFQDGKTKGKIQFGSGWWFNDQKDGMQKQIESLCQLGLISRFVGMLTDSRSFISYTRHDYFRRILCNKLGTLIENGEYPNDIEFVGKIIQDICYNNAVEYFDM
jgi:glucuronate isomerase